jgi:hypothetical protein
MKKTVAENNGTGPPQADKPASGGQARTAPASIYRSRTSIDRLPPYSPDIKVQQSYNSRGWPSIIHFF